MPEQVEISVHLMPSAKGHIDEATVARLVRDHAIEYSAQQKNLGGVHLDGGGRH